MAEYIEKEAAVAIIEERQKQLCPIGMYSRHAVYGTDREKFDAWQEILDEIDYLPAAAVREIGPVLTNADRIRGLSDEELAEWIVKYMDCAECENMNGYKPCHNGECCTDHWLDWLRSSAEEGCS